MTPLSRCTPKQRRRARQLLARLRREQAIADHRPVYLRHWADLRIVYRLHRAGLVCAVCSKWGVYGMAKNRPREVAVYLNREDALRDGRDPGSIMRGTWGSGR